jgi:hypothetical protein
MDTEIHGIPYSIKEPETIKALKAVLNKIYKDSPTDFKVIKKKILDIKPLSKKAFNKGIGGGWFIATSKDEMDYVDRFKSKGILYLPDGFECNFPKLKAIIAHELGHVCTRLGDFKSRVVLILIDAVTILLNQTIPKNPGDLFYGKGTQEQTVAFELEQDWAMELAADSYVAKWGFEEELMMARLGSFEEPELSGGSHPLPNSLVYLTFGDKKMGMAVSSKYRLRRINAVPKDLGKFRFATTMTLESLFREFLDKRKRSNVLYNIKDTNHVKKNNRI